MKRGRTRIVIELSERFEVLLAAAVALAIALR